MTRLPRTPVEARAIKPGTLGIDAAKEAFAEVRAAGGSEKAVAGFARLIAKAGRKYTPEARAWCAEYARGQ